MAYKENCKYLAKYVFLINLFNLKNKLIKLKRPQLKVVAFDIILFQK